MAHANLTRGGRRAGGSVVQLKRLPLQTMGIRVEAGDNNSPFRCLSHETSVRVGQTFVGWLGDLRFLG